MAVIQDIIAALWHHDFAALADPHVVGVVYLVMFATLFLENGLLPASFLPGDSLLLLAGALIARGCMDFVSTLLILTSAASLGCWLSYVQGRWLGNTRIVKSWLAQLPVKYHERATCMFDRHGLLALLAGRFLAFIRTLLPTMAGISGLSNRRFQLFNWLSALLWVGVVISLGYAISMIPFVKRHEDQVMTFLMVLPLFLLVVGLIGAVTVVLKKKFSNA
ncbi:MULTISPECIES: DedA family protein [Kosakonia]|jgi:membrane protein DedA with SNARE-associated domain|uniref:Inner membrane protein YghB n=1 Tax=Kosakonia cowanii JCM 10956 = DSM 18146 TaxID=1300165 RepID=A0A807LBU0_9ENTR|nr:MULTISPECIES: DedA family protein [Kosakonia]MBS5772201.1 DedA family protein [Enterobacter cloacae]MDT3413779.1 membrane protein DedA with SNARE-associated domain [Atlantibacter sp. SORGH_AS_0304]APZ04757.1 DedA family protein [Kosakonia cowanii] [Kosakonia cowanii JCM 10956 = DSM 18146]AST70866.1 DedA family protein [Kosakonia cowanii]MBK0015722.1 DedA family protein [Kosakonia sp. S42]